MRKNYETLDVDKIQERWYLPSSLDACLITLPRCCGDEPWLFQERWEKLFEDFCDVEQKKFDPSRVGSHLRHLRHYSRRQQVSELYDTIKYCALHHRTFLFAIFNENASKINPSQPPQHRKIHELYSRAKALFDLVAPQEYGIDPGEK